MAADDVNIHAARITGDGHLEIIASELPLDISAVARRLSAPPTIAGSVEYETTRLKVGGELLLQPNNTAILVEQDGQLRAGGIYGVPVYRNQLWQLDVAGFSSYPDGLPYVDSRYFVKSDPLDIFRHIWAHIQAQPGGNLGVVVDSTTSPVRVGTELEQVDFDAETSPGVIERVSFEAGPRKLTWYGTFDLGNEIDGYAKETPFDWLETIAWAGTSDDVAIRIRLGYPQLGSRQTGRTGIVYGENCETAPDLKGGPFVNQVVVIGAGEGRAAVRGYAGVADGRIRKVKVVQDKKVKSKTAANKRAQDELAKARGALVFDQITVFDHPNLPLAAIELGNSYPFYADLPWAGVIDTTVRVIGRSDRPGVSDSCQLTVVRESAA